MNMREDQIILMDGCSTIDAIFAVRKLMEKYGEWQQNVHSVFIDLDRHMREYQCEISCDLRE